MITISQSNCSFAAPLTLPATHAAPFAITIQGSGTGTTLDGDGIASRILTGDVSAPKVLDLTLKNLVFRDGDSVSNEGGGALWLKGNIGVTLLGDRFFDNKSGTNQPGGAVLIQSTRGGTTIVRDSVFGDGTNAGTNMSGGSGGALAISNGGTSIEVTGSTFDDNSAGFPGGALALTTSAPGGSITLDGNAIANNLAGFGGGGAAISGTPVTLLHNVFEANGVIGSPNNTLAGGGLSVSAGGLPGGSLTQTGNRFDANSIGQGTGPDFGAKGGGEAIAGFQQITSLDDRYTINALPTPVGAGEVEGAGLAMEGCEALSTDLAHLHAQNLVVAGNGATGAVIGAGVYVGCDAAPTELTLLDSTVAGNSAGAAGATGVAGDGDDTLTLRNSIVTRNPGGVDVAGFASRTITTTDACAANGSAALPGAGNVCVAPRLADPAHGDVHQTEASPTRDRGSNARVPATLKLDYEGQRRILGPLVDMGADEFRDTVRPRILSLKVSPTEFVPGLAKATLGYRLSEPARMTFTVSRVKPGRRVKGRCVKRTNANAGKPRCKRLIRRGSFSVQATAGAGSTPFDGRVGKQHRKLSPGTYRIAAVAIDPQGNRSAARFVTVTIDAQR